jgi:hypothetical protein
VIVEEPCDYSAQWAEHQTIAGRHGRRWWAVLRPQPEVAEAEEHGCKEDNAVDVQRLASCEARFDAAPRWHMPPGEAGGDRRRVVRDDEVAWLEQAHHITSATMPQVSLAIDR